MKLTPWYPPDIKPIRKGVYITKKNNIIYFQHWTGRYWNTRMGTIDGAGNVKLKSIHQDVYWKGIER